MVAGFKQIFDMSTFQASLVQFAYFKAYFLLALPAAFLNERFWLQGRSARGYCWRQSGRSRSTRPRIMTFAAFPSPCSSSPRVAPSWRRRPIRTCSHWAPRRRQQHAAQLRASVQPRRDNIGVLMAALFIMPKLSEPVNRANLSDAEAHRPRRPARRGHGTIPRPGLSADRDRGQHRHQPGAEDRRRISRRRSRGEGIPKILLGNRRYVFGVVAQFFNIAGQGLHLDIHHPVRPTVARRVAEARRLPPADQSHHLPRGAL